MPPRALPLARPPLASVAAAAALIGGLACPCELDEHRVLELGVEVDLHDVATIATSDPDRLFEYLAVGDDGTVVRWRRNRAADWDTADPSERVVSEAAVVGEADLRAVAGEVGGWWAVGDGGTVLFSDDRGESWAEVELDLSADLHAISSFGSRRVIVGDELVLVQAGDGSWLEPPIPEGGWGRLRGVYQNNREVYAVGLGGVIWTTSDPLGPWRREHAGVDVDLFAVGRERPGWERAVIVGAGGTILRHQGEGWVRVKTPETVDLVDYARLRALGAGGELFEVDFDAAIAANSLTPIGTFAEAEALSPGVSEFALVGEAGFAARQEEMQCRGL